MLKAYKYRIFPTEEQKNTLTDIFGQVRFVYNLGLETKLAAYAGDKKYLDHYDLNLQIKGLKQSECPWLKESPSQALQMAMRNLDNAFTNFFRGSGFPKFKSRYHKQSFQLPQGVKISEDKKQVFIPKLKWVGIDLHREFKGKVKTVTISKTTTNKYFISILVDTEKEKPKKKPIKPSTSVGVDMGIKELAITSDGNKFENQGFFRRTMSELRVEQRSLARKKKGSNRYKKQKLKVALLHEKVRNQRRDYLHKISKWLVDNYDTICIEDLSVSNMMKNHNLARAIAEMGWYELRRMLEYKTEWYGKNISVIGKFDPSSKTCSNCGNINKELTLNDRKWECEKCGTEHDRDVNAAINIKNFGLRNQPSVSQREPLGCA